MTLHMLRRQLGDKAFFDLVKRWATEHRGGNVSTAQFIALAQQVAHKDLQKFFTQWLYAPVKPPITLK
jgi:aminopeptidase N